VVWRRREDSGEDGRLPGDLGQPTVTRNDPAQGRGRSPGASSHLIRDLVRQIWDGLRHPETSTLGHRTDISIGSPGSLINGLLVT
jgi:hypothetical protein